MTAPAADNPIEQLKKKLETVADESGLALLKAEYLGKTGVLKLALKGLAGLSAEEKRVQGPLIQEMYQEAEVLIAAREKKLGETISEEKLQEAAEQLSSYVPKIGHLHPITETVRMMNSFFERLGYSVVEGPELENDEYCFQRLNVPQDHPARDMQDTLYIAEPTYLLRTQTSSVEARILATYKPPFKVVCAGRVYRNEKVNKSNHFIFHHYQGVVVLERVSLKDLFGTVQALFKKLYGPEVVIRFRSKYYPEVEPGVGPDMQCFNCHGDGCQICKQVGWLEMGGAGLIHPNVLNAAGINPDKWMGFAFGLGLDRWVMARYNITDIRTLLGGSLAYKYFEHETAL